MFNRRLTKKPTRMTSIIRLACVDGIALVYDTRIIDPRSNEPEYASKILTPLKQTLFIVVAA